MFRRGKPRRALRDTLETIIVAVVLALVIRSFVVEPFIVNGFSMEPTLYNGERLLVNKFWFHVAHLHDGEIIVFRPPQPVNEFYVKRVIATGGQTVSMKNGQVYINGQPVAQPYLQQQGMDTKDHWTMPPLTVPKGKIFVLGDNRAHSEDSRFFGTVKVSAVQGVAFWIIWPFSRFGGIPQ